ncbi:DUF5069 domain-containing protein [Cerasicoccus frondis]|uniref:DUF5069 domain-containing protein n=1 Tax=Cerasicoccus frondis TaxID=490090 RepID=UPI0028528FD8|nr:DUF5069 domain-containing protein [Cerasicoccus frondis]
MTLPAPRDQFCGCIWLPRIRSKAQLFKAGKLPKDYVRPFCHPVAADGHFLAHFQTDKDALLAVVDLPDAEFKAWFLALPNNSDELIAEWNEIAVNLGRPGYPMDERFVWAMENLYPEMKQYDPETVFEMIEYDEGIRPTE